MTNTSHVALILGGSGRTGSLVAQAPRRARYPRPYCFASRQRRVLRLGRPGHLSDALAGTDRVYLVTPVLRVRYAARVAEFLDRPRPPACGTSPSSAPTTATGPREIDIAAVEADLAAREAFTHSILRPAWVDAELHDDHLPSINGTLAVPGGGAARAFVDAADIARSRSDPPQPWRARGARYALTGPQALTSDVRRDHRAVSGWRRV